MPLALACASWMGLAQPASAATQTFAFTGGEQKFTVPAAVSSLHVVAVGATGAKGADDPPNDVGATGGFGDRLEADLDVTPGQLLFIEVGGTGVGPIGGFNGGGSSIQGTFMLPGGGGGGATDIRTCSVLAVSCTGVSTLASRLVVAGGGGGGGSLGQLNTGSGGRGGDAGKNGQTGAGAGGGGGGTAGTQAVGGSGGAGQGGGSSGSAGTSGQGGSVGTGGSESEPGGGGGGGLFGGGAGGNANGSGGGGGGGGSSFASPAVSGHVFIATDATGSAQLAITYKPSHTFKFGKLKRNRHRGTATLSVQVPAPGTLALKGKGVKAQRSARVTGAAASKAVKAPGTVKLAIKSKGKIKRKLNDVGEAKVKVKVTFTPTGGDPKTRVKRVKLIKKLD